MQKFNIDEESWVEPIPNEIQTTCWEDCTEPAAYIVNTIYVHRTVCKKHLEQMKQWEERDKLKDRAPDKNYALAHIHAPVEIIEAHPNIRCKCLIEKPTLFRNGQKGKPALVECNKSAVWVDIIHERLSLCSFHAKRYLYTHLSSNFMRDLHIIDT